MLYLYYNNIKKVYTMEKLVTIGDNKYEIIKNYKNGFDKDEFADLG